MSHRVPLQSRLAAVALAGTAVACLAGCGSATTSVGATPAPSASPSSTMSRSGGGEPVGSPSVLPSGPPSRTYAPGELGTMPAATSGGSSIQVTGPCDGGTLSLRGYPYGSGVALTATLRNAKHARWGVVTLIPPFVNPGGEEEGPIHTAHHGALVIHDNNLTGSRAIAQGRHAWPEQVEVDLNPTRTNPAYCGRNTAYVDAGQASGSLNRVRLRLLRNTGLLRLWDSYVPAGGMWRVAVTITSPAGIRHLSKAVKAHRPGGGVFGHLLQTKIEGLSDLRDFRSVTVSVSKGGARGGAWLTLSRTP